MKRSKLFIKTRRDAPADETALNAQLLIKAGYIHKEMAGVYSYFTLGKTVLENIANVVRQEMDAIGGNEVLMSSLQNKELWEISGRWDDKVVDNWFKSRLASGAEVGIGFSHEEPLANGLKQFVSSYKDLPIYAYQIQTKFRNELRAKSGILRCREFLMKDLYSFSRGQKEHEDFYEKVASSYLKIFKRLGFEEKIIYRTFASGGVFSEFSDEFQILSHIGEDTIYINEQKKIAINKEVYSDKTLAKFKLNKADMREEKAVEAGNIFSLGSKYSDALNLFYTDKNGQKQSILMGCYGVGISRLMGLIAEHFADDKGLAWPESVSPFGVYLATVEDSEEVVSCAERVYKNLKGHGATVLYDDRSDARPGEKFADADLIGLPNRVVISKQSLESNSAEIKKRHADKTELVPLDKLPNLLAN